MAQAGKVAIKVGYLKKVRKNKKLARKYFILLSDSLEYHESPKRAFENEPRKAYNLLTCIGISINDFEDTKFKNMLEIFTQNDVLRIAFDTANERLEWFTEIKNTIESKIYQNDEWRPKFAKIFQGHLKPQNNTDRYGHPNSLVPPGLYRIIVLPDACIIKNSLNDQNIEFKIPYKNCVRQVGHNGNSFMMELGRQADSGEGKLWLYLDDKHYAQSLHAAIKMAMHASSLKQERNIDNLVNDETYNFRDRTRSNHSDTSVASLSQPISVPFRRPPKNHINSSSFDNEVPLKRPNNISSSNSDRHSYVYQTQTSRQNMNISDRRKHVTSSPLNAGSSYDSKIRTRIDSFESGTSHASNSNSPMDSISVSSDLIEGQKVSDYLTMSPSSGNNSEIIVSATGDKIIATNLPITNVKQQNDAYMEMNPSSDAKTGKDDNNSDYFEMSPPGVDHTRQDNHLPDNTYLDMTPLNSSLPTVEEKILSDGYVEMKFPKKPFLQPERVVSYLRDLKNDDSFPKRANSVGSRPLINVLRSIDDKCNSAPHLINEDVNTNSQHPTTIASCNQRPRTSTICQDMRLRADSAGSSDQPGRSRSLSHGATVSAARMKQKQLALASVRAKLLPPAAPRLHRNSSLRSSITSNSDSIGNDSINHSPRNTPNRSPDLRNNRNFGRIRTPENELSITECTGSNYLPMTFPLQEDNKRLSDCKDDGYADMDFSPQEKEEQKIVKSTEGYFEMTFETK